MNYAAIIAGDDPISPDGDCSWCGQDDLLTLHGPTIREDRLVIVHFDSCMWVAARREANRPFPPGHWPGPVIDVEAEEEDDVWTDKDPMAQFMDPQTLASLRAWQRGRRT